ncbi:MAG: carotenoid 1,2-hydratase [Burkholderiales bacterium]
MHGLSIIAFVGSVFSPYYAWARGRGDGDPVQHCAVNVALYGRPRRWTMTERRGRDLSRDAAMLAIGPSTLAWRGDRLVIDLCERGAPLPHAVRGRVTVEMPAQPARAFALDTAGRHRWHPIAPCARVTVDLEAPRLAWEGAGYCDSNAGDEPLEHAFASWHWSRAHVADGAVVTYDVHERNGAARSLALHFDAAGAMAETTLPPVAPLPRSKWGIARAARGEDARVVATLLDAPFYARSLVAARVHGTNALAMHESLDLDRFSSRWVRMMLPFRMPRW